MDIDVLLPSSFEGEVRHFPGYSQISNNIFVTDNEEIAIAIVDSMQSNSLVIFRNGADNYSAYSEKYLGKGCTDFAKAFIARYLT